MEKQFEYLCECNSSNCGLTVDVSMEEAKRLAYDQSIFVIVDGCKKGPEPGYTLIEEKPKYKRYRHERI